MKPVRRDLLHLTLIEKDIHFRHELLFLTMFPRLKTLTIILEHTLGRKLRHCKSKILDRIEGTHRTALRKQRNEEHTVKVVTDQIEWIENHFIDWLAPTIVFVEKLDGKVYARREALDQVE
jgi:hypothetical protein